MGYPTDGEYCHTDMYHASCLFTQIFLWMCRIHDHRTCLKSVQDLTAELIYFSWLQSLSHLASGNANGYNHTGASRVQIISMPEEKHLFIVMSWFILEAGHKCRKENSPGEEIPLSVPSPPGPLSTVAPAPKCSSPLVEQTDKNFPV